MQWNHTMIAETVTMIVHQTVHEGPAPHTYAGEILVDKVHLTYEARVAPSLRGLQVMRSLLDGQGEIDGIPGGFSFAVRRGNEPFGLGDEERTWFATVLLKGILVYTADPLVARAKELIRGVQHPHTSIGLSLRLATRLEVPPSRMGMMLAFKIRSAL